MKKLVVVLLAAMLFLLTGCAKKEMPLINYSPSQYWRGVKDDAALSLHLVSDKDDVLPFQSTLFFWEYYENLQENLPQNNLVTLDGGEYRQGTWSIDGKTVILEFMNGEKMTGTFSYEGLLLDYDGGFLLDHCEYVLPY